MILNLLIAFRRTKEGEKGKKREERKVKEKKGIF
jgi:hypothetical protein